MMWEDLSMREKAAFMKIALNNGIADLDEIRDSYNEFAEGGGIHIKKKNRGKFTESAQRAGMGVQEYARHVLANKEDYSSTLVKRANFARNAAKWHAEGGLLNEDAGKLTFPDAVWGIRPFYEYGNEEDNSAVSHEISDADMLRTYENYVELPKKDSVVHQFNRPQFMMGYEDYADSIDDTVKRSIEENLQKADKEESVYSVLDRNNKEFIEERVEKLHDLKKKKNVEERNAYLNSLTSSDLRKVQQKIADKGGYDKILDRKNRSQIKDIQRMLVYKGYLKSGNSKPDSSEIDGIIGKKTRSAWRRYNVDGQLGSRTRRGYEYINKDQDKDQNIVDWSIDTPTKGIEGCAQWVTKKYESAVGNQSKQHGVFSDAWKMPKLIEDKGGKMIYNIYDDSFNDITNVNELKEHTRQALQDNPLDYSLLRVGDVVGIYLPSSANHGIALKEGTTKNTHVGIVTGFDDDGMPIVEHNIHQIHKKDRADKLTGSISGGAKIATVSRTKMDKPIYKIEFNSQPSSIALDERYMNSDIKKYMDSIEGAKENIQFIFPDADMDDVQKIAVGVLKRETNFMNNKVSDQGFVGKGKDAIKNVVRTIKGYNEETKSSNLTKFKLSSLNADERKFLDINTKEDLENPEKAGIASMYLLSKNYDYFKRLQKTYPDLGITDDDIRSLTILSYNQGMGRLYDIGFDKETGEKRKEELDEIRYLADFNNNIKDVNSTNYKYLGKLGERIYNKVGKAKPSYIASALHSIDKYITDTAT